ncbi:hypothetical protein WJX77_006065 [Trebouxia sp. C0004]
MVAHSLSDKYGVVAVKALTPSAVNNSNNLGACCTTSMRETAGGMGCAWFGGFDLLLLSQSHWWLWCFGKQTYSAASRGPPSEGQQHSQNGPGQPENAPSDTRPDNPPAEDHSNQNAAPQSHNIATVIDVAAVSSVVGANQPMTEDAAAQEAADVAPAEQAITSKAEPGTQLGSQGPLTHLQQKLLLYTCPLA